MDLSNMSSLLAASDPAKIITDIPVDKIVSEAQVRGNDSDGFTEDSLTELAESIARTGLHEPIIVRHKDNDPKADGYVIICGERRWRAFKLAATMNFDGKGDQANAVKDFSVIPAIVRDDLKDPKDIMIVQVTENAQRKDLSPLEIGLTVQKLIELGVDKKEIARKLGKRNDFVTYAQAVPELPEYLALLLRRGVLTSSLRGIYDYCKLAKGEDAAIFNDLIDNWIAENKPDDNSGVLDRTLLEKFKKGIERIKHPQQETPDAIPENTEVADEGDTDYGAAGEDEYPDREEREHSAAPTMAAASQENSAPTAAVGSSSDFTDRDTKAGRDLSDGLERQEESAADADDGFDADPDAEGGESDSGAAALNTAPVQFAKILCEYDGKQYWFTPYKGTDLEHVIITALEDADDMTEAKLTDIKLIKGIM